MLDQDYDKLAWGLVKDEIRRLVKPRTEGALIDTILDIFWAGDKNFYSGHTSLSDVKLKKVKNQVSNQIKSRLGSFNHILNRSRMEDNGPVLDVSSQFVWDFKEMACIDKLASQEERFEKFLELHNINYAIGKRKLYVDVISSHIIVNQHTLYRMLQRGAVGRDPIALLTNSISDWGKYATLFMISGKYFSKFKGSNVIIPFSGGAILGKIGFTKYCISEEGWNQQSIRFFNSITHGGIQSIPHKSSLSDVMDGVEGHVTLQMATWIPEELFRPDQQWAYNQIQSFAKKHHHVLKISENLVYRRLFPSKDQGIQLVSLREFTAFKDDLLGIYSDPRWKTACKW
jgi:hypothetical protein